MTKFAVITLSKAEMDAVSDLTGPLRPEGTRAQLRADRRRLVRAIRTVAGRDIGKAADEARFVHIKVTE